MRCLVTGGAGFIGSHLVERLVRDGHDVLVVDDLSTGSLDNLRGFFDVTSTTRFLHGDLRSYADCHKAVQGREVVFHLAALGSVPRSVENPFSTHEVNVTGTLNMLEAARVNRVGVKRFVYSSSSSVYGEQEAPIKNERMVPCPTSPYGVSKLAGERYCCAYWHTYGLQTISLRYFNVFGPRQNPEGDYAAVVPRFLTAALRGEPMLVYGDGKQTRDFTYVSDVVEANMVAAFTGNGACYGKAYNVGGGHSISVNELADVVADLTGQALDTDLLVEHRPLRAGDVLHSNAGTGLAAVELGFRASVDTFEGLKRTAKWKAQERA